jgi:hypothetical protein
MTLLGLVVAATIAVLVVATVTCKNGTAQSLYGTSMSHSVICEYQ